MSARRVRVGRNGREVGLSNLDSSAVGCLERLAGGLLQSDLERVEAVVVLDGADPEGGWMGLPEHLPLLASAPKTDSCGNQHSAGLQRRPLPSSYEGTMCRCASVRQAGNPS
jgi:hypothetical protein